MGGRSVKGNTAFFCQALGIGKRNPGYSPAKAARVNAKNNTSWLFVVVILSVKQFAYPERFRVFAIRIHNADARRQVAVEMQAAVITNDFRGEAGTAQRSSSSRCFSTLASI